MRKDFYYKSSDGSTDIHAVKWEVSKPRAIIQIAHGITEYIDRYDELAKYLNKNGFMVVGNDHLGHGKSISKKHGVMSFGEDGSWQYAVQDLYTLYKIEKEEYKNIPYIILGFSLGSFLVRSLIIDYSNASDGVILVGTGETSKLSIKLGLLVANSEIKKHGYNAFTKKIDDLTFKTYNKKFKPNKTKYDWLCKSEKSLDIYTKDKNRGEGFTTGLFRELLNCMSYDGEKSNIKKMNQKLPILFLSGGDDPVGEYGKGVQRAYNDFKKCGIKNISIKIYPKLRHDILHEDEREDIYKDITNWIEKKIIKDNNKK